MSGRREGYGREGGVWEEGGVSGRREGCGREGGVSGRGCMCD